MVQEYQDQTASVVQYQDRLLRDGCRLVYAWFEAMHTRIDIVIHDRDASFETIHDVCRMVADETVRIERMASRFLRGSEVDILNSAPAGEWVVLSGELADIISDCRRYSIETGGLFDVTASKDMADVPFDRKIEYDLQSPAVRRLDERVKVDLSGYIKGYALDKTVDMLRASGLVNALVNFGNSSVYAMGNHPGGSGWQVETADGRERYMLHDQCLTTSGNNTVEREHIINPVTGKSLHGAGSVSVVTDSGSEGEVMSIVAFLNNHI